ncbi:MAG: tyrosine-type recombinase/integrase [Deltaproteobacteria bacterium]|nr:tyrosine-type recombinase/integrase [Deltaproteobacteria bacterium]
MKRKKTKHRGVYKVGDIYYITYYVGPKKYEKAVGPRLSMALKEKMERENKAKRGSYEVIERQEKTTFDELMTLYEEKGEGKEYILQFKSTYLQKFGGLKLSQINREDLFTFRDTLKETPKQRGKKEVTDSTVNRALAGLRRLFSFAVARGYMEDTPFPKTTKSGLFFPEQKGLRNFFTEDQMEKIVEASPSWLKPMVLTAYYTGLREGELLGLRWDWIDLKDGVIYLPSTKTLKDPTGKGQRVVMQGELISLFQSLPRRSEWVFCQPSGEPFKQWHIYEPFKNVLKAVGIDPRNYSWKELRHTTASLMHRKGVPALVIKDQLRHTNVKTTVDFYIGADLAYQREQIEKLSLNSGKIVGNDDFSGARRIANA